MLEAFTDALGLCHLHRVRGVCRALHEAAREAEDRWRLLFPCPPLHSTQAEAIQQALLVGHSMPFPPRMPLSAVGFGIAHYLTALADGCAVAVPAGTQLVFVSPYPAAIVDRMDLSMPLQGAPVEQGNPRVRGVAAVRSGPGHGDILLADQRRRHVSGRGHALARLRTSLAPYAPRSMFSTTSPLSLIDSSVSAPGPDLDFPSGLAFRRGRIYVSDVFHHRVVVYDAFFNFVMFFGAFGTAPGLLFTPYGLDVCDDGWVYVCDNGNDRISVHSADHGGFRETFRGGQGHLALTQPRDCAVVHRGSRHWPIDRLVVTEMTRVQVLRLDTGDPLQILAVPGAQCLWGVALLCPRLLEDQIVIVDSESATLHFFMLG